MVYQEFRKIHEVAIENGQIVKNIDLEMAKNDEHAEIHGNINGNLIAMQSDKHVHFLNNTSRRPNVIMRTLTPYPRITKKRKSPKKIAKKGLKKGPKKGPKNSRKSVRKGPKKESNKAK